MSETTTYNRCIGTMATVCQANTLILKKMVDCGEFSKEQVDLARQAATKSLLLLDLMVFNYLKAL